MATMAARMVERVLERLRYESGTLMVLLDYAPTRELRVDLALAMEQLDEAIARIETVAERIP